MYIVIGDVVKEILDEDDGLDGDIIMVKLVGFLNNIKMC